MSNARDALHAIHKGRNPHHAKGWTHTYGDSDGEVMYYSDGSVLNVPNYGQPHVKGDTHETIINAFTGKMEVRRRR